MEKEISQTDVLKEYFRVNPNKDVRTLEIVDWATKTYFQRTGKTFRDPDRGVRKLYQERFLQKIGMGIYRYDPAHASGIPQEDFDSSQKQIILQRDSYKCVICGRGKAEGMDLHVDHIRPKELGGKAELENGQTLCSQHNMLKKTMHQTETGKRMFIRLYELAKAENDKALVAFCEDVLKTYETHGINGHIKWKPE